MPKQDNETDAYRRVYGDFDVHFSEAVNLLAKLRMPGQVVTVNPAMCSGRGT